MPSVGVGAGCEAEARYAGTAIGLTNDGGCEHVSTMLTTSTTRVRGGGSVRRYGDRADEWLAVSMSQQC